MKGFLTQLVGLLPSFHQRFKGLHRCLWLSVLIIGAQGCGSNDKEVQQLFDEARRHRLALQLDSSVFYLAQAEEAMTRRTSPLLRARVYFTKGNVLEINRNHQQANKYLEKAVEAYQEAGNRQMQSYILTSMGYNHYKVSRNLSEALAYVHQAVSIAPDDTTRGTAYQQMGWLYHYEDMPDSARFYLRKSLTCPYFKEEQSFRLLMLSDSYFSTDQLDSSKHYALEALKFPASPYQKKGCYRQLYKIAQLQGDTCAMVQYAHLSSQQMLRTSSIEQGLSQELQDVHQIQVDKLAARHKRDAGWLLVACGAVVALGGGVWLLVRFVRYYKRWVAAARVRHKNLHVRSERLVKENGKLATRNKRLASENENLAARNKHLREALERERQQRESYAQLKQSLLGAYKTERNRVLESRLQHLKEQLDAACAPAGQFPLLSPEYKKAIVKGYGKVLHWDEPQACLALFNEQFDHFADRAEMWCANRRSQQRSTARLCCLLLVDTMKTHVELLMDYKEGTYERTLTRLQQHTRTVTEQDFRLELYKVVFLKAKTVNN